MKHDLSALLEVALRHLRRDAAATPIPRLELRSGAERSGASPCLYRSMACFILQGHKEVSIGDQVLRYGPSRYLISALDLPLMGKLQSEDSRRPYVGLTIVLNAAVIAELLESMPECRESGDTLALSTTPMTEELLDVLGRLLALLDHPDEIPVLAPLIERELLFRLLQGPNGHLLRQIASPKGPLAQVRRAVGWIGEHFAEPITIDALCHACGMSRPSLHRSFRALVGQSPLQYQKQLRLLEARRLLMTGEHNASSAAFSVGYESSSQFSREYLRQFKTSPSKDMPRHHEGC